MSNESFKLCFEQSTNFMSSVIIIIIVKLKNEEVDGGDAKHYANWKV